MKQTIRFLTGTLFVLLLGSMTVLSQNTYNGNGNTGFGDVIGNADLDISDNGTTITFELTKGSGTFNDALVIYIDSESGGITSTSNLTDTGDQLRQAISGYDGTNRSTITFASGFSPDHVIAANIDNSEGINFAGIWDIVESGSHNYTASANISSTNPTVSTYNMTVDFSEIGISDSTFKFVATYINNTNAFRSDEAIGTSISGGNPGQGPVTFDGFFTYQPSVEINGDAGWRLLSFPIKDGTVEDVSDDSPVQGITGGDNTSDDANFFIYDSGGSFTEPTKVSTAIDSGLGFAMYYFDNTTAGSSSLPVTLDADGYEPANDVTVSLNAGSSNEFTLVGNPFATHYNTNSITASGGSIQDNIQLWDDGAGEPSEGDAGNTTGSYSAQDRTSDYVVSAWQGFFVETSDASVTSITLPRSGRTSGSTSGTFFEKQAEKRGDVAFKLTSESTYDEALKLSFRDYATVGNDRADASKLIPLENQYATMAFVGEDKLQSVFSLPYDLNENYEIKLEESLVGVNGEFTLSWEGMETVPSGLNLELRDYETGERVDMSLFSSYTFEASATAEKRATPLTALNGPVAEVQKAKSAEGARFGIVVSNNSTVTTEPGDTPEAFTLEQNYPNPFNPTTSIQYSVAEAGPVTLTIYNVMGQQVETLVSETKSAGSYRVSWNAANMASGIYYYRLQAGNDILTRQMTLIK